MNRTRIVLVSIAALVGGALAVPATASADGDPAGTVVLAAGPSGAPRPVQVEAVTPEAVVYRDQSQGLLLQRRASTQTTFLAPDGTYANAAGSLVLYGSYGKTEHWINTAKGTTGVAPSTWKAVAPSGGLILTRVDAARMRLSLQNAATGVVRTLATFAYSGEDDRVEVAGGPNGAAVWWYPSSDGTVPASLSYIAYSGGLKSFDLGAVTSAESYFSCTAPSVRAVACIGSGTVFGATLGATAASVWATAIDSYGVAVGKTSVAWTQYVSSADGTGDAVVSSVPIGGGPVSTAPAPLTRDSRGLVSDGTSFYAEYGTTPPTAAVETFADATKAPTAVAAVGAADYEATAVAIAPGGRVGYIDNRQANGAGWQRTLTATAGGVTVGGETLVTPSATGNGLALSGARSAWAINVGGYSDFSVTSPLQPTADLGSRSFSLSGNRVVKPAFGTGGAAILDLNTSLSTSTGSFGDEGYDGAIWGNTYYFYKDDGSVWRKNLASSAGPVRVLGASTSTYTSDMFAWGDRVAVNSIDRTTYTSSSTIVDTTTQSKLLLDDRVSNMSAAGYVLGSTLHSWDSTHSVSVTGFSLVATASIMAWIGDDGRPRAAPVPWTTADPPRSLGNPLAPATVAAGGTWTFDLPTSAPLTSCRVDILKGTKVIRTLSCDSAYVGGGDVVVRWDTKNTSGGAAATGPYTWRVTASNADGPVQLATGSAGTVSGSVSVTTG